MTININEQSNKVVEYETSISKGSSPMFQSILGSHITLHLGHRVILMDLLAGSWEFPQCCGPVVFKGQALGREGGDVLVGIAHGGF